MMDRSLQPITKRNKTRNNLEMHASNSAQSKDQPCCLGCRRRRIRCDRQQPCSNCSRKGVECVLPKPKSKPSRSGSKDLLDRLERLEEILHTSSDSTKNMTSTEQTVRISEGRNIMDGIHANNPSVQDSNRLYNNEQVFPIEATQSRSLGYEMVSTCPNSAPDIETKWQLDSDGKSHYVGNGLFGELLQEVSEIQDEVVHAGTSDGESAVSVDGAMSTTMVGSLCSGHEFILGFNSTMSSLTDLHPPSNQALGYWILYKQNVDPLVRVLHKPTTEDLFISASRAPSRIPHSTEPVLFAVYLAVTISLGPDECQSVLKIDRASAIKRYRFAAQQALTRANFLTPKDTNVVAAFVILITCIRSIITAGEAWMLVGLLIRIAHSLELHKDGSHLGLSPYDTEIRRRIWWQVCYLDICISERHGVDPTIAQGSFSTMMPLNLDDSDIWPEMREPPAEHEGPTEMMFDLARHEIGATVRNIISMSNSSQASHFLKEIMKPEQAILKSNEAALENLQLRLERRYLRYCTLDSSLHRITVDVSQMMLAKARLMIYLPRHRQRSPSEHMEERESHVFRALIDVIRYARRLETQQKIIQYSWLFKIHSHWSALGLLLTKLNSVVPDPAKEDAWTVIDEAWAAWSNQKSMPKLISVLMQQARAHRFKSLDHNKQIFNSDVFRHSAANSIIASNSNAPDSGSPITTVLGNSATPSSMTSTLSDLIYGSSTTESNSNNAAVLDTVYESKNSDSMPIPIDISNTWAAIANQNSDIPNSIFLLDDVIMEDDLKDGLLID